MFMNTGTAYIAPVKASLFFMLFIPSMALMAANQ